MGFPPPHRRCWPHLRLGDDILRILLLTLLVDTLDFFPGDALLLHAEGLVKGPLEELRKGERVETGTDGVAEQGPVDVALGVLAFFSELLDELSLIEICRGDEVGALTRRGLDTFTRRLPDMALRLASSKFAYRLAAWLARAGGLGVGSLLTCREV